MNYIYLLNMLLKYAGYVKIYENDIFCWFFTLSRLKYLIIPIIHKIEFHQFLFMYVIIY